MRQFIVHCFFAAILAASCLTAIAEDKKKSHPEVEPAPVPATGFPGPYTKAVERGERFENPAYFSLLASDGIRKVDARALYSRLQAAVAANERYKALYLARVFTDVKPDAAASWTNRAQFASALGLTGEAAACEQNAKDPTHLVKVPLTGILPGMGLQTKPASLSDWAAATALLSDGIVEKEGRQAVVAYKDLVSGIHQATPEEVANRTRSFQSHGLPPPGPWADPEPVQLRHVLANVFELRSAEPMQDNPYGKGGMIGAMVMAGISGTQMNTNPAAAQMTSDLSQQMLGRASQVPSHLKGGSYTRVAFESGKEIATAERPQTSGENSSVNKPLPFLWASGGSMEPSFMGDWKNSLNLLAYIRITTSNLDDLKNGAAPRYKAPLEMQFPKLMTLCVRQGQPKPTCSIPLSLMEVLLTPDDVAALAPDLMVYFPDVGFYSQPYDTPALILERTNGNGGIKRMWGADKDGAIYVLHLGPYGWLTEAR